MGDPMDKIQAGAHGSALSSLPLVNPYPPIHSTRTTAPVSIKKVNSKIVKINSDFS